MAPGNISVRIRHPATAPSPAKGPARSIRQFAMRGRGAGFVDRIPMRQESARARWRDPQRDEEVDPNVVHR